MTTEAEYHKSRRMFALVGRDLKIAPIGDRRSHIEWFFDEGWVVNTDDRKFDEIVRGSFVNGKVYIYRGRDFLHHGCRPIFSYIGGVFRGMNVPDDAEIWVGAFPGEPGVEWKGRIGPFTADEIYDQRERTAQERSEPSESRLGVPKA